MRLRGKVIGSELPRFKNRWFGILLVKTDEKEYSLYMSGSIAQWFETGEEVTIEVIGRPREREGETYLLFDDYRLWRTYNGAEIPIWPAFSVEKEVPRLSPLTGEKIYSYSIRAREAIYEKDYEAIAELEQYHYASQKELVALWRCEKCGEILEANAKPICPECDTDENVHILEIKGSTPASRFLMIELFKREEFEPEYVAYVRVDPPVPKMHRRLPDGSLTKDIREKVFPEDWFHPVYHPEELFKKRLSELRERYAGKVALRRLWDEVKWEALHETNTAVSRIARVVVHPDYRSDGLGKLAVQMAIMWVNERRIPEMRREKQLIETIAQMARYNPFFEKVGFKYVWDTASGRPVLYYPLTEAAKGYLKAFLEKDPVAREHGGKLCLPSYGKVEPLEEPIKFEDVFMVFENELDVEGLPEELKELLEAFGVRSRVIQRQVLRNVDVEILPGEIVVIIGASGAGKTTFLRLILGACAGASGIQYRPTMGRVKAPENAKIGALIPGEMEPEFGDESILEHIYHKMGNLRAAVEVLNRCGLSDAVLYRARYSELSTGQKERARLASLLAEKPNLLLIDEFAAHLDALTAMRIARRLSSLIRESGMTAVIVTHRKEIINALAPDKILFVGYGTVKESSMS
ncbi:MAG TPA: GNAT family N-acetyltransferase [Candidatus Korarchaeota archaeon]|nr:GNAT family N-acetyltransferase [Candidatus Korarchaeota archaeon]